jgi:hypothetical protein
MDCPKVMPEVEKRLEKKAIMGKTPEKKDVVP